jgi:hypothetical protein
MITPTTITTEDQIYLTGSPVNLRIKNLAGDATISSVVVELYVWSGDLDTPPTLPSYTLVADKVSIQDDYINFQISEIIASHINGTKFAWASGDVAPSIAGEGVFFQYKYEVTSVVDSIPELEAAVTSVSNFATKGYRYDYEQVGDIAMSSNNQPYLGLTPINYTRHYTDRIKYYKREFDFTKTLAECTSENIILSTVNEAACTKLQLGDKYLVVYINRLGLWDYFTPYGKAIKTIKTSGATNPRLYRNPNSINNSVNHSKQRAIESSDQTFVLNTGDLHELMTEQIEEVIYSPLLYLIEFTGETYTVISEGLTVDSTDVTVDSTLYTVDNQTITTEDIGYFSTYKQIPVICSTETFVKRTRLNDKGKINYDLEFEVTMGRINNLR